jgi:hypothetical protein
MTSVALATPGTIAIADPAMPPIRTRRAAMERMLVFISWFPPVEPPQRALRCVVDDLIVKERDVRVVRVRP